MSAMKRLFLGVPIPKEVRETVAQVSEQLQIFLRRCSVSWIAPENYHLTLHFLGEVEEEKIAELRRELSEGRYPEAFPLQLVSVGAFPSLEKAQTLFLETTRPPFAQVLQERTAHVLENLGFRADHRKWHAHITLGRVRAPVEPIRAAQVHFHKDIFRVDRFELIESTLTPEGSLYHSLASYVLPPSTHPI